MPLAFARVMTGDGQAAPERNRPSGVSGAPHPALRGLVARDHTGCPDGGDRHRLVLPASVSVPLILKVVDSPRRPAEFAIGDG